MDISYYVTIALAIGVLCGMLIGDIYRERTKKMSGRADPLHAMTHELKIDHDYLRKIQMGIKTWECRKDDRDYQKGDYLLLQDYDRNKGYYVNNGSRDKNQVMVKVLDVFGRTDSEKEFCKSGYVTMSIKVVE
ncbi:DUF3850 domain-containing protein [Furfurilactobacillus milii]|uniref:DUF3850 domain-containing protein n=1 Tax=Furfurilactobacillus milii TaxID=2888272 RepID=UPI001F1E6F9A|nr:DUF3850 domain-containing protein [Furfurilactobacillus milii]MCF6419804.1 DUF3850 domain-containing protein [Furfurilactobacillus milii]